MDTFWFWYDGRCLTAQKGINAEDARSRALAALDSCPGVFVDLHEAPFEFRSKLSRAEVRTYDESA